ncbi:hypothetical protein [Aeromicrobium sp.]|uniref:hypothetical protein n=1 Tax=Aeromicrobium sp. TaxID=1871063 RepID=UPI0030BD7C08
MTKREVTEAEYDAIFGRPATRWPSPGGEVSEAQFDAIFGGGAPVDDLVALDQNVKDLERVGLPSDIAEKAARDLEAGTFDSFGEAAVVASTLVKANGSAVECLNTAVLAEVIAERKSGV